MLPIVPVNTLYSSVLLDIQNIAHPFNLCSSLNVLSPLHKLCEGLWVNFECLCGMTRPHMWHNKACF